MCQTNVCFVLKKSKTLIALAFDSTILVEGHFVSDTSDDFP